MNVAPRPDRSPKLQQSVCGALSVSFFLSIYLSLFFPSWASSQKCFVSGPTATAFGAQLLFPLLFLLLVLFKKVLQLRLLLDGALHFYQVFTVDRGQPAGVGKTGARGIHFWRRRSRSRRRRRRLGQGGLGRPQRSGPRLLAVIAAAAVLAAAAGGLVVLVAGEVLFGACALGVAQLVEFPRLLDEGGAVVLALLPQSRRHPLVPGPVFVSRDLKWNRSSIVSTRSL